MQNSSNHTELNMNIKRLSLIILIAIILVIALGPRPSQDYEVTLPQLPADLDTYLAEKENKFGDLKPETKKQIIWASPAKERTKLSVVYVHGFSGTHKITAPTFRNIAKKLNANLYLARLSGHGRTPNAMAEPNLQDWINDTAEAIAVGKAIGDKLILISLSTGSTLVSMVLAEQPNLADVLINMAPNFNPADPAAQLIVGPWGESLPSIVIGTYNKGKPKNELHDKFSTQNYHTDALITMMLAVQASNQGDYSKVKTPTLWLYSDKDKTVSIDSMKEIIERWGSPLNEVKLVDKADGHVITGDIMSPASTRDVEKMVIEFVGKAL